MSRIFRLAVDKEVYLRYNHSMGSRYRLRLIEKIVVFKTTRNDLHARFFRAALRGLSTRNALFPDCHICCGAGNKTRRAHLICHGSGGGTRRTNQVRSSPYNRRILFIGEVSLWGSAMPTLLVVARRTLLKRRKGGAIMHRQHLLGCIRSLREIRTQLDHLLNPRVSMEFDAVIGRLQECLDQRSDHRQLAKIVDSTVLFLGRLIGVTTNISDFIDRYKR